MKLFVKNSSLCVMILYCVTSRDRQLAIAIPRSAHDKNVLFDEYQLVSVSLWCVVGYVRGSHLPTLSVLVTEPVTGE